MSPNGFRDERSPLPHLSAFSQSRLSRSTSSTMAGVFHADLISPWSFSRSLEEGRRHGLIRRRHKNWLLDHHRPPECARSGFRAPILSTNTRRLGRGHTRATPLQSAASAMGFHPNTWYSASLRHLRADEGRSLTQAVGTPLAMARLKAEVAYVWHLNWRWTRQRHQYCRSH